MTAVAAPVERPALPGAYWRQWSASAISNLGDGINFAAMPLLALTLTRDERLLALTAFATFLPWVLIALPVGVVVDRLDRQSLMVAANLVRVGLFAVIAVGAVNGWLTIWLLFGLLVVVGMCEVVFDSTAQAFLPMLVASPQLARANGLLFAAEIVAGSILGLSIGALLFDAAVGLPFSVNAASFAIAATLIVTIRTTQVPPVTLDTPLDTRLRAGMRWLLDHPLLRTLAAMFTVTNLGLMFGQGIFVKYAIDELGLDSLGFGLLLAITAMGGASGGLLGHRVIIAIGLRLSVVAPYLVFGAAQLVIGLAPPAWMVGAAGFALGMAITIWNVVTITVRQQLIPPDRFGRVNSVYRWLGA
ncbi:MAG: MFS transporter, partial [Ilumatobacter sp.]|uniref:MFS transporter n=1 Tax=Ilumatobacter sp. TaxID=1967498 RepID=UPI002608CB28